MKQILKIKRTAIWLPAVFGCLAIGSCKKDNTDNGLKTDLQPTFTMTPVAGKNNTYAVANTTASSIATRWDFDKGAGFALGRSVDTVFFPDKGNYSVKMQAMGKGGIFYDATPQPVTIATSDPIAGNIVQGGKFNAGDAANWTIHPISPGVSFAMADGKMVATGGNGGHAAVYQAISVQANKKYVFGMTVSGSGATDTWFEVYFGSDKPTAGADYSSGGKKFSLNTWAGCGKSPFNGNIATIGCDGDLKDKNGAITFSQSGTVYLFIKTGGANLGTSGISIDNVELRLSN